MAGATLQSTGQMAAPGASTMAGSPVMMAGADPTAPTEPKGIVTTDRAAAAWAIGAILVLALLRRGFRGAVV